MTHRSTLPILFAVVIVDLIGFGVVIPILPFYAKAYGANASVLGVLLTSYAAAQALSAPLWGRLSDRIGRRPVMLLTLAGTSLALFGLGFARSLAGLFVARVLGGVFGANISVATAYVSDVTAEHERTRWMGMIGASFGVGFVLGPALGGALAPYGYHVPMLVAGAMAALNGVMAWFLLAEPPAHAEREGKRLRLPADPRVRKLCLAGFLFACGVSQLETVFAFFMLDIYGYDARRVAYILVLMAVIMVAIQGGGIRSLARRFGERRLLLGGAVLLGASFVVLPALTTSVPLLLVALGISAVGRGVSHPSMLGMVSRAAAASSRGVVLGAFQSSASLARVVGPVIAGALYDAYYGAPFLLASGLMLAVLGVATTLPGTASVREVA